MLGQRAGTALGDGPLTKRRRQKGTHKALPHGVAAGATFLAGCAIGAAGAQTGAILAAEMLYATPLHALLTARLHILLVVAVDSLVAAAVEVIGAAVGLHSSATLQTLLATKPRRGRRTYPQAQHPNFGFLVLLPRQIMGVLRSTRSQCRLQPLLLHLSPRRHPAAQTLSRNIFLTMTHLRTRLEMAHTYLLSTTEMAMQLSFPANVVDSPCESRQTQAS
jgi:hypothetical protein